MSVILSEIGNPHYINVIPYLVLWNPSLRLKKPSQNNFLQFISGIHPSCWAMSCSRTASPELHITGQWCSFNSQGNWGLGARTMLDSKIASLSYGLQRTICLWHRSFLNMFSSAWCWKRWSFWTHTHGGSRKMVQEYIKILLPLCLQNLEDLY